MRMLIHGKHYELAYVERGNELSLLDLEKFTLKDWNCSVKNYSSRQPQEEGFI